MNQLVQLRQEIAKMRLVDLAKEHGKDSSRVNNYRRKMGDMITTTKELDKAPVQQKRELATNKVAPHRWAGNY